MAMSADKHDSLTAPIVETTTLATVEKVSRLMDSKFRIPGTSIRFGLDPVFSLIPIIGDLGTYVISGMLIYTMYRHGASRKVVTRMVLNSTIDALIGAIPLVGTLFDIGYKANNRNVKLLKEHYYENKHNGSGNGLIILIIAGLLVLLFLVFFIAWKLFAGFLDLLL